MKKLSEKQQAILRFLRVYQDRKDRPPSIREIQDACGISSTSVVDYNLRLLERAGYIRRDREVSRGIELLEGGAPKPRVARVPLLGAIAAGAPIPVPGSDTWTAAPEGFVPVPESMLRGHEDVYALRVKGTSMIDALVNDGDIVLVRRETSPQPGEMVVAWLRDREETTLKRYYPEDGRVRLQPANSAMEPIYVDARSLDVQGKVVGVLREMDL
jgi:repressor LexA